MSLFQLSRQGLRFRDVPLVGGLSQVGYTVEACRWLYQPAFCYARTFRNTRAVVDYAGAYSGGHNSDEGVGGLTEAPHSSDSFFSHWKMVHCSLFEQQKSPAMEGALTIVMLTLRRNNDNNNSFLCIQMATAAQSSPRSPISGRKLSLIGLHALPEQEGDNQCVKWEVAGHLSPRYVHDIVLLLDSRPSMQVPRCRRVAFAGCSRFTKIVGILASKHFSMASKVLTPHAFYYWMRGVSV